MDGVNPNFPLFCMMIYTIRGPIGFDTQLDNNDNSSTYGLMYDEQVP